MLNEVLPSQYQTTDPLPTNVSLIPACTNARLAPARRSMYWRIFSGVSRHDHQSERIVPRPLIIICR
jgi:hypothetical protein